MKLFMEEQLNITSRCITRSRQDLRARDTLPYLTTFFRVTVVDARSYTMKRYVMMRIPGTHAPTKRRRSPGVHPPLGDRGGQSGGHGRERCGRWPEPSLLCADGGCRAARDDLCARRSCAWQQCKEGLTAFPLWVGRERQRPGGDTSIAWRQPGDTAFAALDLRDGQNAGVAGNIDLQQLRFLEKL